MKLPAWLIVYDSADPRTRTGYWFSVSPPSCGPGLEHRIFRIEVEVPDLHEGARAAVVEEPQP